MKRLALDHITVTDTTPVELVQTARAVNCEAVCLFMEPMTVLPHMPPFNIYGDKAERRRLKSCMEDLEVTLDLAYPFTLGGRTDISGFAHALDCAAELGARMVNVLVYDREPARRIDKFSAFCDLAVGRSLSVALEFYPPSQVPSLADALDLVLPLDRPGQVGVNADLLHLMRSGGAVGDVSQAPVGTILYGQICDGPALCAEESLDFEASSQRLLIGAGVFDGEGFLAALPPDCPISIELPQEAAIKAGIARSNRACLAVDSFRQMLER